MSTRREFLQTVGATGAAAAGLGLSTACGGGKKGGDDTKKEAAIPIPAQPILVVINIAGGNDWLNMFVPIEGANAAPYTNNRPTLQIAPTKTTKIETGMGLNNDFTGMADLYKTGRVAFMPGIGMANPNLSHFTAGDLWGQGWVAQDAPLSIRGTGWLGRYSDGVANFGVLQGLTTTNDVPVELRGSTRNFVSITSDRGYVYPAYLRNDNRVGQNNGDPYFGQSQSLEDAFGAAVQASYSDAAMQAVARAGKAFFDAQNTFGGATGQLPARAATVAYPGDDAYPIGRVDGGRLYNGLAGQLKLIAQMIASGLPTSIYYARIGGWDTHSNQLVSHANLQRILGGCLDAFYKDLKNINTSSGNAQDRVMIMGWSEFGRRVKENDGGTDHGTAGLSFCMGRAVKGGVYGDIPSLSALDSNGNMNAVVDFRALYATVLDRWLGQAPSTTNTILGASYPRLGFL
jgi:uncharacterized protein (DUF1501 family)